jgi:hypothetical protein
MLMLPDVAPKKRTSSLCCNLLDWAHVFFVTFGREESQSRMQSMFVVKEPIVKDVFVGFALVFKHVAQFGFESSKEAFGVAGVTKSGSPDLRSTPPLSQQSPLPDMLTVMPRSSSRAR